LFAKRIRKFIKELPKTISNIEDGKQLIKSSGSVGANYSVILILIIWICFGFRASDFGFNFLERVL